MSFASEAAHAHDPTLTYGRRVMALVSCVQRYHPIGFEATLSFLEEIAGPYRSDGQALRRAVDALVASRRGWLADIRDYARERSRAKQRGRRSPSPDETNPDHFPQIWYGMVRQAALHALRCWKRDRLPALVATGDEIARTVDALVVAVLVSDGRLDLEDRHRLDVTLTTLRRRVRPGPADRYPAAGHLVASLLHVARLVEIASDGTDAA